MIIVLRALVKLDPVDLAVELLSFSARRPGRFF
jgi:hypothetical protein